MLDTGLKFCVLPFQSTNDLEVKVMDQDKKFIFKFLVKVFRGKAQFSELCCPATALMVIAVSGMFCMAGILVYS